MSRSERAKVAVCVYCGQTKPVTADHVPPKNLFPKRPPRNLRTVPSCFDCNNGFSKDDEYFRLALTITENAKGHPDRDAVVDRVQRSLNAPAASGLRKQV